MDARAEDIFIYYNDHNITYENMAYALEGRIKSMQAINIKKGVLVGLYFDNITNMQLANLSRIGRSWDS